MSGAGAGAGVGLIVDPFAGFVQPLPLWQGHRPVISHGFDWPDHKGGDWDYDRIPHGEENLPWQTRNFQTWPGVPILCIGPGVVWSAQWETLKNGEKGYVVVVDHGNVEGYGPLASQYTHLASISVKQGDRVAAGDVLGYMGFTGTSFAHLHFALSTDVEMKWGVDTKIALEWRLLGAEQRVVRSEDGSGNLVFWLAALYLVLEDDNG